MKKNYFIFKLMLVLSIFLYSSTISAADKNEAKKTDKGNEISLSKNKKVKTIVKQLSFKQKVKLIREIRKETKKVNKNRAQVPMIILYILAIFLPPLAVGLYTDWGEPTLWNLLFTILFWIPGIIHAFYILLR